MNWNRDHGPDGPRRNKLYRSRDRKLAGVCAGVAEYFGFDTTITERTRTAETRWLELRLSGEESEALELLQEPGRIRRLEQRGCAGDDGG